MVWHSSFQWICFGGPARHSNFQFFTIYRGVFYTDTFTKRCVLHSFFYTEMVLHTGAFRLGHFLGRGTLTRARLETQFREGSNHSGISFPSILTLTFTHKKCLQRYVLQR